jgi:hypothetical protein
MASISTIAKPISRDLVERFLKLAQETPRAPKQSAAVVDLCKARDARAVRHS